MRQTKVQVELLDQPIQKSFRLHYLDWMRVLAILGVFLLVKLILRPFFPAEHDWADFIFKLFFFIIGYILYADERFAQRIKRDWPIMLTLGVIRTLFFFGVGAFDVATVWMESRDTPGFYLLWSMWSVNSWCWTLFMMNVGIRYLDFANKWLQYGQGMIMPFFFSCSTNR